MISCRSAGKDRSVSLIHILGAGIWQTPTIVKAKEIGHQVLVSDLYAERPGYYLADYHECVDICDRDETLRIAKRYKIDGIICDTTDVGVPTMAYVAGQLGLPGISLSTALASTNKYQQRQALSDRKVPQPTFELAQSEADIHAFAATYSWPVVVKPVDSQSARGVTIVKKSDQVTLAFNKAINASKSKQTIVETFLAGMEISVEGYVVDGQLSIAAIGDKAHFPEMPTIARRITYPAILSPKVYHFIKETQAIAVNAMGLKTGVFHAEYMVVNEAPYLIEMAARGGGSRIYTDIVPGLHNYDVVASYINYAVSGRWDKGSQISVTPPAAANLIFFRFPKGLIPKSIIGLEWAKSLPSVRCIDIELELGKPIPEIESGRSRHGYALIFGMTREDVIKQAADIYKNISILTEDGTIVWGV